MRRLLQVSAIRTIEAAHQGTASGTSLMIRAAEAAAKVAMDMCQGGGRVLVMAGPGNNGGDAWVVARKLQAAWYRVTVLSGSAPKAPEAVEARASFLAEDGKVSEAWPQVPDSHWDLIIDGLLGIGISRPPAAELGDWIGRANQSGRPILALDVPSGLDADTGTHLGCRIRATRTITFIADKPGLHTAAGPSLSGHVNVAELDIDWTAGVESSAPGHGWLLAPDVPPAPLPHRELDSHKGRHGTVGIVGAARGMAGAGILAARAALHAGAGKVFLAPLDEELGSADWVHPEIMFRRPRDVIEDDSLTALVVGPGLGTADPARNLLEATLKRPCALILDADALNLIAKGRALQTALKRRGGATATILTPHPAEAARLLGTTTAEVNADRVRAALALATRFDSIAVLKGAGSVIAVPDGSWYINGTGNPGMAVAGMGDVLVGIVAALAGQPDSQPDVATRLAVWAHGLAADRCIQNGVGPVGLTPGEVLTATRSVLNGH